MLFPGPDSNVPIGEGDLIDIFVHMVATALRESMMTANFEPMHHTLLEVVEYVVGPVVIPQLIK